MTGLNAVGQDIGLRQRVEDLVGIVTLIRGS
jgi:hypothetical protein